jgi:hypothetical protein
MPTRATGVGRVKAGAVTLELTVLSAVAVAVLIVMAPYTKRAMSGWLRDASDSLGEQYDPVNGVVNTTTRQQSQATTASIWTPKALNVQAPDNKQIPVDIVETITVTDYDVTSRKGSETVGPLKKRFTDNN